MPHRSRLKELRVLEVELHGIARPVSRRLPFRWVLLGTLLPGLIDKPIFLAIGLSHHFHDGGWMPGKRGLAHTALFGVRLITNSATGNHVALAFVPTPLRVMLNPPRLPGSGRPNPFAAAAWLPYLGHRSSLA